MAIRHSRRATHDLTAQARRAGVRLIRFLYTDNGGITRGKATHIDGLAHRLTDGIGLTVAMQAMNMLDQLQPVEGLGPVGEIRLVPDPQTFTVLPYAPHAAAMTSDMRTIEGAPWEACPRDFLKRQITACAAAGFTVRAAFECEFTLAVKQPDGRFEWREVALGETSGRAVEIKQGLKPGERIALEPSRLISEEEKREKFGIPPRPTPPAAPKQ